MGGMESDEAHTGVNPLTDLLRQLVGHLLVCRVTPPDENISVFEQLVGQAELGGIERSGGYLKLLAVENSLDCPVDTLGIKGGDLRLTQFVPVFVPYGYSDSHKKLQKITYATIFAPSHTSILYNKLFIKSIER